MSVTNHQAELLSRADDSVKKLRVSARSASGQSSIENCAGRFGSEFDKYYVHLSGYCGHVNPHTFAVAPEMLDALYKCATFIEALANNDPDEPIADNGMTVLGKLQYDAPALAFMVRGLIAEAEAGVA